MKILDECLTNESYTAMSASDMNQVYGGLIDPFSLFVAGVALGTLAGTYFIGQAADAAVADHMVRVGRPITTPPPPRPEYNIDAYLLRRQQGQ